MGLFSEIQNLINEHGSSSILRERLALLGDKADAMEKENKELKKQIHQQSAKIHELEHQLVNQRMADEFVEHRGALFKRKPSGGYHHAAYCPACRIALSSIEPFAPFFCNTCEFTSHFTGHDLPSILIEVEKENP